MGRAFFLIAAAPVWIITTLVPAAWALSVSPGRTEVRLAPGAKTHIVVYVQNPHEEGYDVQLSQKKWVDYPDNKDINLEDWLILPKKKQFHIKAGQKLPIELDVVCPKDAVGELMGMVSVSYQGVKGGTLTSMISTPVYLRVKDREKISGRIAALGAGTHEGVFLIAAKVSATGNVRLRPVGTIDLLNEEKEIMATYIVPERAPIFPGQTIDCVGQGPARAPKAGKYLLKARLTSDSLEMKDEQWFSVNKKGEVQIESKSR